MSIDALKSRVEPIAERIDQGYSDDPNIYQKRKKIRGAVWGFHYLEPPFLTILDSPFMQRLRYIRQTAFAHNTYVSANHHRFEHSLGVFTATKQMLDALEYNCNITVEEPYRTETKLAALIHDIGHGPFSHASEEVYGRAPVFSQISDRRFDDSVPSEELAYCLIKSNPFQSLLDSFERQCDADNISDKRISDMILGNEDGLPEDYQFLRFVINGPFDADKFDYVNRDGFFTDLDISLDTDRLLHGLELSDDRKRVIIDSGSLSALEQVYIGKSQLYSQVYHHQKVRAAAALVHRLFVRLQSLEREPIDGHSFKDPETYLALEDPDILSQNWEDKQASEYQRKLKNRELPKRALVLTYPCFPDVRSDTLSSQEYDITYNWSELRKDLRSNFGYLRSEERTIMGKSPGESANVVIDIPGEPPGAYDQDRPLIQLGKENGNVIEMNKVFPAESWANAYEAYRSRSYIFCDQNNSNIANVTEGALSWLDSHGIRVTPLAVREAKVSPKDLNWDKFINKQS